MILRQIYKVALAIVDWRRCLPIGLGSAESLVVGIAKIVKEKGYQIANSLGAKIEEPHGDTVGILKILPAKKGLFGMKEQEPIFLGRILTRDFYTGSTSKWVLEVYGKQNLAEAEEIRKALKSRYEKVDIRIDLKESVR